MYNYVRLVFHDVGELPYTAKTRLHQLRVASDVAPLVKTALKGVIEGLKLAFGVEVARSAFCLCSLPFVLI